MTPAGSRTALWNLGASGQGSLSWSLIDGDDQPASPWYCDLHIAAELGVVLAGQYEVDGPEATTEYGPGEAWLYNSWEPHTWRCRVFGTRVVVFMFPPELVDARFFPDRPWTTMLLAAPPERPRRGRPDRDSIGRIAEELWRESEQESASSHALAHLTLLRLLVELDRAWPQPAGAGAARGGRSLARLRPALDLMSTKPPRRISAEEAAASCGLSRSRFDVLFRESMAMPFAHFETRARVTLACQQLVSSDAPVDAIARATGFAHASHLHRAFVKLLRSTPGQYRRRAPRPHA